MRASKTTVDLARRLRRDLAAGSAAVDSLARASLECRSSAVNIRSAPTCSTFYCAKARLAVEVDGIGHDMSDRPQRDLRRDAWLTGQGVTVMRISATEVMRAFDDVVDAIVRTATARIDAAAPSTTLRAVPLPRGAGEGGARRRRGEDDGAQVKERS